MHGKGFIAVIVLFDGDTFDRQFLMLAEGVKCERQSAYVIQDMRAISPRARRIRWISCLQGANGEIVVEVVMIDDDVIVFATFYRFRGLGRSRTGMLCQ